MSQAQLDQLDKIGRQVREAIVAPYLENTEHQDTMDYTLIMDSVGEMSLLSTQTIQDVIDELQGALDSRP